MESSLVWAGAAGCRERELHLARGPGGPASETDVAVCFSFLPFGLSRRGGRLKARPPCMLTDEPVLVGTEVYGDGRGKHVISVQAGRHSPLMALCSHTPTRHAAPPLCSCPCMCRTGPDIKSARCFSEPACMGCSPLTTMSVTSAKKRKSIIRVRDDDGGAALHCIRSTSCHPSPGQRKCPAQLYARNFLGVKSSYPLMFTRACQQANGSR